MVEWYDCQIMWVSVTFMLIPQFFKDIYCCLATETLNSSSVLIFTQPKQHTNKVYKNLFLSHYPISQPNSL